jgi:hypothetical protein
VTSPSGKEGPLLAPFRSMGNDEKKRAIESQVEKIDAIVGREVLGYDGAGREEHSGENSPTAPKDLEDELADNRPEDT